MDEVSALKKMEGDAVLLEEVRKDGSWAPCLLAFTAVHSFMGREGRMGGGRKWGRRKRGRVYSPKRIGDHPMTILGTMI